MTTLQSIRVAFSALSLIALGYVSSALAGSVIPVQQSAPCACWAASAAMMLSARDGVPYTEMSAAQAAGSYFEKRLQAVVPGENCENQGLLMDDINKFSAALGLKVAPPNNPSLSQWREMLTKGPVWAGVIVKDDSGKWFAHTIVVTNISASGGANPDVTLVDPEDGAFHNTKFDILKAMIEKVPEQWDAKKKLPIQFLYWQ